jgi:hypothetical protein
MFKTVSALRITRTFTGNDPAHLPPFAVWWAFPTSDYYGGSVAMGLAPFRRSRVSCVIDVQIGLGASFIPLRSFTLTLLRGTCMGGRSVPPIFTGRGPLPVFTEAPDVSRRIRATQLWNGY